jgi:hypothetical protein
MRRSAFSILILVVSGCATSEPFVFRPTETPNVTRDDRTVARYSVPRALPRGELFVTSQGIAAVSSSSKDSPELHVRITVFNVAGEGPWAVDIRDQIVTLPGGTQVHANHVNTAAAGAPILTILPGERIAMDLYFELPEHARSSDSIAAFDFIWQVSTDRKRAAGTVPFGRFLADDPNAPTRATTTVASAAPF